MNNLKEVNEQIEANKEILNTFPRNNAKNIKACLTQIQEYKQTFTDAQSKLVEEMKKGRYKKVLVVATGALMSPITIMQKESIPAVAHAISLEVKS